MEKARCVHGKMLWGVGSKCSDCEKDNQDASPYRPGTAFNYGQIEAEEKRMALRDIFAAHALTGILAGRLTTKDAPEALVSEKVAENAYYMADKMLEARLPKSSDKS